ncbi:hypothetical protein [Lederbergia citrea]|uniref:hypothetical protein n=1 Tax=Lederbergia citrea TaxID=2833581 RepID=UPI001BC9E85A|nr:hypothetical protein [Lederbergia citrea]MBS4203227.1 hypothetical protein [Lederbergia citrea]
MNIRNHYSGMARLYIHQSILYTIFLTIVVLPCLKKTHIFPVIGTGIFILASIVYYFFRYLYFSFKVNALPRPHFAKQQGSVYFLIMPSPVSAYHWKLFSSNGICKFSIVAVTGKEKKSKIKATNSKKARVLRVMDHEKNMTCLAFKEKHSFHLYTEGNELLFSAKKQNKREFYGSNGLDRYQYKKMAYNFVVTKNGRKIMTISQGLMPTRLQKLFYASTPVVTFDSNIKDYERHFCLALFFR